MHKHKHKHKYACGFWPWKHILIRSGQYNWLSFLTSLSFKRAWVLQSFLGTFNFHVPPFTFLSPFWSLIPYLIFSVHIVCICRSEDSSCVSYQTLHKCLIFYQYTRPVYCTVCQTAAQIRSHKRVSFSENSCDYLWIHERPYHMWYYLSLLRALPFVSTH